MEAYLTLLGKDTHIQEQCRIIKRLTFFIDLTTLKANAWLYPTISTLSPENHHEDFARDRHCRDHPDFSR